jgi:hypothetical protein
MIVVCMPMLLRERAVMAGWVKGIRVWFLVVLMELVVRMFLGVCVRGGGWGCCGVCMCVSISDGVYGTSVEGEVGVSGGCAGSGGFRALHYRRLNRGIVFFFMGVYVVASF